MSHLFLLFFSFLRQEGKISDCAKSFFVPWEHKLKFTREYSNLRARTKKRKTLKNDRRCGNVFYKELLYKINSCSLLSLVFPRRMFSGLSSCIIGFGGS